MSAGWARPSAIDAAVAKLFALEDFTAAIITANIAFARKINGVTSAVHQQNERSDEKWLTDEIKTTFSAVMEMNNERNIVAHSPFESHTGGGVEFDRTVAKARLKMEAIIWTETDFAARFEKMRRLEISLENVLRHIQPHSVSQDFSDPRNSARGGF